MQICGVDDAGRGSMIGPLVIAGVSVRKSNIKKLSNIGVKDSKKLSPKRRTDLYEKILKIVDDYHVSRISPRLIDSNVTKHNLNNLEARYMAKIISKLKPEISYVDSCDVNPKRFGSQISKLTNSKIHSYHHADTKFVVVSAASIIAKVNRDKSIEKIAKKFTIGSGYPSDLKTVNFITEYFEQHSTFPNFVRKSWKPVQKFLDKSF